MTVLQAIAMQGTMPPLFATSGALAIAALTPAAPFIPVTLLLSSVIIITRQLLFSSAYTYKIFGFTGYLSLVACIASFSSSSTALDSLSQSLLVLFFARGVTAFFAVGAVCASEKLRTSSHARSPWVQHVIFPAVWTTTWALLSKASPLGRLGLWTPLDYGSYDSLRPYIGASGMDWIVAAWAVVLSDAFERSSVLQFDGVEPEPFIAFAEDEPEEDENQPPRCLSWNSPSVGLGALLLISALPSFYPPLPDAPYTPHTTPITVACVLPSFDGGPKSALDRYVQETAAWASRAKIFVWPENAVRFESEQDRAKGIDLVVTEANRHAVWIGVSFDEPVSLPKEGRQKSGMRRSGFALISPQGVEMEYYKRHLVPCMFLLNPTMN
jgi:hypothetical protein